MRERTPKASQEVINKIAIFLSDSLCFAEKLHSSSDNQSSAKTAETIFMEAQKILKQINITMEIEKYLRARYKS